MGGTLSRGKSFMMVYNISLKIPEQGKIDFYVIKSWKGVCAT